MRTKERYDAVVIGAGQAGTPLSRTLAQAGWKTALIEREHVGGTCVNEGCTPTKTMVASARVAYLARRAANELSRRLARIFLRDETNGTCRPVYGDEAYFQNDPHWRDYVLFYEYFDSDSGAGLGASHQTRWTALVANLIQECGGKADR